LRFANTRCGFQKHATCSEYTQRFPKTRNGFRIHVAVSKYTLRKQNANNRTVRFAESTMRFAKLRRGLTFRELFASKRFVSSRKVPSRRTFGLLTAFISSKAYLTFPNQSHERSEWRPSPAFSPGNRKNLRHGSSLHEMRGLDMVSPRTLSFALSFARIMARSASNLRLCEVFWLLLEDGEMRCVAQRWKMEVC